ncbi:MAG TPA: hydroxymethylbilane synthase, partial [Anaerolineae bacterium]|nr:hydroxymethylbilane synthase [Anaerolineae bacterium]
MSSQRSQTIAVGSRGSDLALWQTRWVISRLQQARPDIEFRIQRITTRGDVVRDRPLPQVGGKGLFVKEIEAALLAGEIDLAV